MEIGQKAGDPAEAGLGLLGEAVNLQTVAGTEDDCFVDVKWRLCIGWPETFQTGTKLASTKGKFFSKLNRGRVVA